MGLFSSRSNRKNAQVAGSQASSSGPARLQIAGQHAVVGASSSSVASRRARSNTPPLYQYQPLQRNEMRLFVLRPGRYDDPILVQIRHYPVLQRPNYTALSFVWGNAADATTISVEGRPLRVTRTLVAALKGLRHPKQEMLMWGDQICINQLDDVEKTEQVKHMCVIYPQASTVLCWLGDDDGTAAAAFAALRKWASASGKGRGKEKLRTKAAEDTIRQLSQDRRARDALERLFRRPWWRRAWTLQEVCPSQTNRPILVCGQHQLSWYDFFHACYTMFQTLNWEERSNAFSEAIVYVLPMLQTSWADASNLRLSYLVPVVARREATDRRDKIFSLLGIASAAGLRYPPADYTLNADQVCIKYTRAIIEADRSLAILFAVARHSPGGSLPTWTIKLDRMLDDTYRLDGHARPGSETRYRFQAALRQPPILSPTQSEFDRVLRLQGVPIDTVDRVIPMEGIMHALANGQQTWNGLLDRAANICRSHRLGDRYGPTGGHTTEALLEALTLHDFYLVIGDPKGMGWPGSNALYQSYQRHVSAQNSKKGRLGLRAKPVSEKVLQAYTRQLCSFKRPSDPAVLQGKDRDTILWLEQKAVADLMSQVRASSMGCRLFVTSKGYIGMGPQNANRGDHVCLLFGASTPFMLRPVRAQFGEAYELLDEVYCEGFMMGEGLRDFVRNGELRAPSRGWSKYALV